MFALAQKKKEKVMLSSANHNDGRSSSFVEKREQQRAELISRHGSEDTKDRLLTPAL